MSRDALPDDLDPDLAAPEDAEHYEEEEGPDPTERGSEMLQNRRRIIGLFAAVALLIVGIYVVFPKVVGLQGTFDRLDEAKWYWILVAFCMPLLYYSSYAVLVRSAFGKRGPEELRRRIDLRAATQITFAALAASALFSAAGAGGMALTYWALRKAGMSRRRAVCRMVAFLVILYSVYLFALIVFGTLLAAEVLPGEDHLSTTIVPAAIAGGVLVLLLLVALIPGDFERRLRTSRRFAKLGRKLAAGPAVVAMGVRTAIDHVRHRRLGAEAVLAAVGFWAGNVLTLWAAFKAFGVDVPFGVVVQGFFVGMLANLAPSPAAGVGTVDAGLIGAFVLFGLPSESVFPAVLVFRLIGFWLPIPLGVAAYLKLVNTAHAWEEERRSGGTIKSKVKADPGEVRA
jgi:uncharacterized protein (TIRG00374 family)